MSDAENVMHGQPWTPLEEGVPPVIGWADPSTGEPITHYWEPAESGAGQAHHRTSEHVVSVEDGASASIYIQTSVRTEDDAKEE